MAEGAAGMYLRSYLDSVQMAEYKQSDADLEILNSNASTIPISKQLHRSNDNNNEMKPENGFDEA